VRRMAKVPHDSIRTLHCRVSAGETKSANTFTAVEMNARVN